MVRENPSNDDYLRELLDVFPANRVGVRLSPNGVFDDMGSPDFREQFGYTAKEVGALGLAYVHVVDGLAFGFHKLGEPMTLEEFRGLVTAPLVGNCGYALESATAAIEQGRATTAEDRIACPDHASARH